MDWNYIRSWGTGIPFIANKTVHAVPGVLLIILAINRKLPVFKSKNKSYAFYFLISLLIQGFNIFLSGHLLFKVIILMTFSQYERSYSNWNKLLSLSIWSIRMLNINTFSNPFDISPSCKGLSLVINILLNSIVNAT